MRLNLRRLLRLLAALGGAAAVALAAALMTSRATFDPVPTFEAIRPGMTFDEVKTRLAEPRVAKLLAESFGSPVPGAEAALRGDPSFEAPEWGRVDGNGWYESEWLREWRAARGDALSTGERRRYVRRQWGVGNSQSYDFIAVFGEDGRVASRSWTVPAESRARGWLRWQLGWYSRSE